MHRSFPKEDGRMVQTCRKGAQRHSPSKKHKSKPQYDFNQHAARCQQKGTGLWRMDWSSGPVPGPAPDSQGLSKGAETAVP